MPYYWCSNSYLKIDILLRHYFKKEIEDLTIGVMDNNKGSDDGIQDFMNGHSGKFILFVVIRTTNELKLVPKRFTYQTLYTSHCISNLQFKFNPIWSHVQSHQIDVSRNSTSTPHGT